MMNKINVYFLILILFLVSNNAQAQMVSDELPEQSKNKKIEFKKFIVPGSLMLVGSMLSGSHFEKQIKHFFHNGSENDKYMNIPTDDIIQYAPIVELYAANLLGVKAKNHWFDQTKYLIITNIITGAITHAGKGIINKQRPNGSDHAFPSGHSSFSFSNAAVLYQEYKDTAPGLAKSGYVITSVVGGLRIVNNHHWLSDVMVGAGLGILVTKLVYHFEPLKNWNPFKKSNNVMPLPSISSEQAGLYFRLEF